MVNAENSSISSSAAESFCSMNQCGFHGRIQVFKKGFFLNKGLIIDHIAFSLQAGYQEASVSKWCDLFVCNSNNTAFIALKARSDCTVKTL